MLIYAIDDYRLESWAMGWSQVPVDLSAQSLTAEVFRNEPQRQSVRLPSDY